MLPALRDGFGNASSLHWFGQRARAAVDDARGEVAALVGASPAEIVFTGSGTEADNLALRGRGRGRARAAAEGALLRHRAPRGRAHRARAGRGGRAGGGGARDRAEGIVDLDDLRAKLDDRPRWWRSCSPTTRPASSSPWREVARLAHERGALVHCDAVQAAGKVPVDVRALDVDLLALSAHKIYGPQGVGALFVRRGTRLKPLLRGGSQERNRRAGTENVAGHRGAGTRRGAGARGAGRRAAAPGRAARPARGAPARHPGGAAQRRRARACPTPSTSRSSGTEAESLLMALDLQGLAVSTGAACAAGAMEPSHVLRAMGLPARAGAGLGALLARPGHHRARGGPRGGAGGRPRWRQRATAGDRRAPSDAARAGAAAAAGR